MADTAAQLVGRVLPEVRVLSQPGIRGRKMLHNKRGSWRKADPCARSSTVSSPDSGSSAHPLAG